MEIVASDSFFRSLKKIAARARWYWKVWDCLRYDIPRFVKNVYLYRKDLWNTYQWDAMGSLQLMRTNIKMTSDYIEKYGHEIEESRLKKVEKMKRAVEILDAHIADNFYELAELQLGRKDTSYIEMERDENDPSLVSLVVKEKPEEREANDEIRKLARKLEKDTWKELFEILRGQDPEEYQKYAKTLTSNEQKDKIDHWYEWFDGSGLRSWWD